MSDIDIINQEILEVEAQLTELTDSLASSNFAEATARTASDNYNRQLINNLSLSIPALFDGLRTMISTIDTTAFVTTETFDTAKQTLEESISEIVLAGTILKAFNITKVNTAGVITYDVDTPGITAERTPTGIDITFNVTIPAYVATVTGEMTSTDAGISKAKAPKVINKLATGFSITAMIDSTESPEDIIGESIQVIITNVV